MLSNLKKFKALDNIRNTIAGHISIDIRIACAMINFDFKPCCPDLPNSKIIARRLRMKSELKQNNNLNFLLFKRFNKNDFEEEMLNLIDDFPKLTKTKLKKNVFLGSYHLRTSSSYLAEIIKNQQVYVTSRSFNSYLEKKNLKSKNSKIISAKINPRHSRSRQKDSNEIKKSYNVFIEYLPNLNSSKGIKSINNLYN